jgi:hypothetical protein
MDPMEQLTAYFITTDRVHAGESLASLQNQELYHPIVIIRNVRPISVAHRPTLECSTPYCLILDDDVIIKPKVVRTAFSEFERLRVEIPEAYKMAMRLLNELEGRKSRGGFRFYYVPHLQKIGWPDAPHVSWAQARIAQSLGFRGLVHKHVVGIQKTGTPLDVYKQYLWEQIRANAGQRGRGNPDVAKVRRSAEETQDIHWWMAYLGLIDGQLVGEVQTSKDEYFLGPLGRQLDFANLTIDVLRHIVHDHLEAHGLKVGKEPRGA